MANGDLLVKDWQFQIADTLYGTASNGVSLDLAHPVTGIGHADAKTQDVVFNFGDGSYGNPDYKNPRLLTIPVIIKQGTAALSMAAFHALLVVWTEQVADIDLAFQFPGWKFLVNGRPRGVKDDQSQLKYGAIRALLRFDCLDPTITTL